MAEDISFKKAQTKLVVLWSVGSLIIFSLWFFMTLATRFDNIISDAWGWLLPNILPTLSLILGVFFYQLKNSPEDVKIEKIYLNLCFYISFFYFLILLMIILSYRSTTPILDYYRSFNIVLAPLQGIVGIPIGIFFFKK
jgi:hypothetical protein